MVILLERQDDPAHYKVIAILVGSAKVILFNVLNNR